MPRTPRIVVPGVPHHVTQRGNRRQTTFFRPFDFELYRQLLADQCQKADVAVWAYCLMPNHVHLILVPSDPTGLRRAMAATHARYTRAVNRREGWRGVLWQGRFASFPMDDRYLMAAARYVLLNPVRARLVERPDEWPYSSAEVHLKGVDDALTSRRGLDSKVADWPSFLAADPPWAESDRLRRHSANGAPLGEDSFLEEVERATGRALRPGYGWSSRRQTTAF